MIQLLRDIPRKSYIACSGGVDSMAALSFVLNNPNNDVEVLFFNHNTPSSNEAESFLRRFCEERTLTLHTGLLEAVRPPRTSQEEFWRDQRYKFFDGYVDKPIITAHHLDDVVEFYVFSSLHGKAKITPYRRGNVIRPFLLTKKEALVSWCDRKNTPWIEDTSNTDNTYARNRIRNVIMPEIKKINPGIQKVVAKKVKSAYNKSNST
jgi:tRNA(Ile)-lysidine synthase